MSMSGISTKVKWSLMFMLPIVDLHMNVCCLAQTIVIWKNIYPKFLTEKIGSDMFIVYCTLLICVYMYISFWYFIISYYTFFSVKDLFPRLPMNVITQCWMHFLSYGNVYWWFCLPWWEVCIYPLDLQTLHINDFVWIWDFGLRTIETYLMPFLFYAFTS